MEIEHTVDHEHMSHKLHDLSAGISEFVEHDSHYCANWDSSYEGLGSYMTLW